MNVYKDFIQALTQLKYINIGALVTAIVLMMLPIAKIFSFTVMIIYLHTLLQTKKSSAQEKNISFSKVFMKLPSGLIFYSVVLLIFLIQSLVFFAVHSEEVVAVYEGLSNKEKILENPNNELAARLSELSNAWPYKIFVFSMYALISMLIIGFARAYETKDLFKFKNIGLLFKTKMLPYVCAATIVVFVLRVVTSIVSKFLVGIADIGGIASTILLVVHGLFIATFAFFVVLIPFSILAKGYSRI